MDTARFVRRLAKELTDEGRPGYDERWIRERILMLELARLGRPITGDEARERREWIESLSDASLVSLGAHIALNAADRAIDRVEATLFEKLGLIPSHILDTHVVLGSDGRPGLDRLFDREKWSRKTGVV